MKPDLEAARRAEQSARLAEVRRVIVSRLEIAAVFVVGLAVVIVLIAWVLP